MNSQSAFSSFPVDTLWHTNWGFCVRHVLAGSLHDFWLHQRIVGSHREYVEKYIPSGRRREHENVFNRHGTSSPLLPGTVAHVQARISATLDDIPLDPIQAQEVILRIWNLRIASSKKQSDKEDLQKQRDEYCYEIQRVISGEIPSILKIEGIRGICSGLETPK